MPDPTDTRMYDLIALITILGAMLISTTVHSLLAKVANNYRDDILLGVKNGIPLSLKHRWDILTGDWVSLWTIIFGTVAFVGFIFLKLARLSEDEHVRLLGYFAAGTHLWGVVLMAVFIPMEAVTLVKHLRAQRPR